MAHGDIEILDHRLETLDDLGALHQSNSGLQGEPGREQSLDHGVVQLTGDSFAVFEHRQICDAGMQTGVFDDDARRAGERGDHFLVDVGEDVATRFVIQVEVPEDVFANADGHAEERTHRRMVRRKPVAVGVLSQIGKADRLRIDDEQTQDAVALGQVADLAPCFRIEADGDELREPGAGLVEHTERAVLRVDEIGRHLDDALQRFREVELGTDREHRVEQPTQLTRSRQTIHQRHRRAHLRAKPGLRKAD